MRARGMQVLTDQVKAKRPGATIWGEGDEEHEQHTSGHNDDDSSSERAEDEDADTLQEHRALDFKVDEHFTHSDGDYLVTDLTTDPGNQARIIYINWGNYQYHRRNGFKPEWNGDDPHPHHVHVSGEADADENTSPWNLSNWGQESQEMTMFVQINTDPTPRPVYKSDGFEYAHLTSGSALSSAQAAGYQVITVPDRTAFEALCGKPRVEAPPAPPVNITPEQIAEIARQVADQVLGVTAQAQRASADVLDGIEP